jgi:hypothetical protein
MAFPGFKRIMTSVIVLSLIKIASAGYCTFTETWLPKCSHDYENTISVPNVQSLSHSWPEEYIETTNENENNNGELVCNIAKDSQESCTLDCADGGCMGADSYCDNVGCSQESTCYCSYYKITEHHNYFFLGDDGLQMFDVSWDDSLPFETSVVSLKITSSLNKDVLMIRGNRDIDAVVLLTKDKWSLSTPVRTNHFETRLPKGVWEKSGWLRLQILMGPEIIHDNSFLITGRKTCEFVDCLLCYDAIKEFSCLPPAGKFFLVVLMMMLSLAALVACPGVIWVFYAVFCSMIGCLKCMVCCPKKMARSRMMKNMMKKMNNLTKQVEDQLSPEEIAPLKEPETRVIDMDDTRISLQDRLREFEERSRRVDGSRIPMRYNMGRTSAYAITMMSLICLLGGSVACSDVVLISDSSQVCSPSSNGETCEVSLDAVITFRYIGEEICLSFGNDENSASALVKIRLLDRREDFPLSAAYYTSKWTLVSESVHRCRNKGNCKDSICENTRPSTINPGSEMTNPLLIKNQGESSCRRSCGGWNCGCFKNSEGCVFSRYAIVPKGNSILLHSIGSGHKTMNLTTEVQDDGGATVSFTTLSTDDPVELVGGLNVEVVGGFDSGSNSLSDYLVQEDSRRLIRASRPGFPSGGSVGDIQSNDDKMTNLIYDRTMVEQISSDKFDSYRFSDSAWPPSEDDYVDLPGTLDGVEWSTNGDYLSARRPGISEGVMIRIWSSNTFTITKTLTLVCAELEKVSEPNGCYDCEEGWSVSVRMRSSCSEGIVKLSKIGSDKVSLYTSSLRLTNNWDDFLIEGSTRTKNNNFEIVIMSDNDDLTLNLNFEAKEDLLVRDGNTTSEIVLEKSTSKEEDLGWFKRVFKGVGSFFDYVLMVFFYVGIILLIVVGVKVSMIAWSTLKMSKKKGL